MILDVGLKSKSLKVLQTVKPNQTSANSFSATFANFRASMKRLQHLLAKSAQGNASEDAKLINAYFGDEHRRMQGHLHIRRTLDQFYYIGIENTECRDIDQVVQRYTLKVMKDLGSPTDDKNLLDIKLIMVDQLWMWVLGKGS
jgi:hypothetical protein